MGISMMILLLSNTTINNLIYLPQYIEDINIDKKIL